MLEVPEPAPGRVAVDLERVVLRAVEEEDEGGGDDDGFERDDPGVAFEAELPLGGGGSGRRGGG